MDKKQFAFGKDNFIWLAVSAAIIIIGFILVSGGKTTEETGFDPRIFDTRRLLIAPVVIMSGFGLVIYSILKKTKE
ncbi:membrane protein [Bacteroidia bacterium]|nr:membrane protein [Bacteroidia bacterium]